MPEGWGWNLSTIQALGSIATFLTALGVLGSVLVAVRTARAARDQANAVIRDSNLRTRPWVGLTGVEFDRQPERGLFGAEEFDFLYINVGLLPAQNLYAHLELTPVEKVEDPGPIVVDVRLDTVFPNDPRRWHLSFLNDDTFAEWQSNGYDLGFSGHFLYKQGGHRYTTLFQGVLWFSEHDVPVEWDNTHVE